MTKNNILWTSKDAASATHGTTTAPFEATGVSIDTRSLKKDELYVALKGDKLDGHDYVDAAFKAGASAAVVRKDYVAADPSWPLLRVNDTAVALEDLGRFARTRSKAAIIGVAGSVGKTGTKELLAIGFGALGKTHASKKSFNNHWGVPLSLANLPADAQYGIFEIGMNHPGEIINLTDQVKPHIAIITTIGPEHIENFTSIDAIADANAEIFLGMNADGIAVLNLDNEHYRRLKTHAEKQGIKTIVSFGEDEQADSRLIECDLHADSSKITADVMGERVKYKMAIPGRHIALNSLGALTVIKAAGGNVAKAVEAIRNSEPVEGRGNRFQVTLEEGEPPMIIIDESYNANPASMKAAFSVFEMVTPAQGGRRIAVLGDMLELGKDGPRLHAELANPLLHAKTDLAFCCGPQMDALYQLLPPPWHGGQAKDSRELAALVTAAVKPGDVVLVKGSAGSKMGYIVHALQSLQLPPARTKDQRNAV